jgi:predicted Zn-dependent protease
MTDPTAAERDRGVPADTSLESDESTRSEPSPDEPGTETSHRDDPDDSVVDVGVLVAHSPGVEAPRLEAFAQRVVDDAAAELAAATDLDWRTHPAKPEQLSDRSARRPSEFLDEAALHMVTEPYDLVVVVTDVPVTTRSQRVVEGLASPVARILVVSTRRLRYPLGSETPKGLDDEGLHWNAVTLVVHLLGHVLGAKHDDGGVMEPFTFDPSRRSVPAFDADVRAHLHRIARQVPEESSTRGRLRGFAFHAVSLARNPGTVVKTLLDSRAPLLPFSLPRLSTAAVTPTLILVFSAEAWDVGLNLSNLTAILFAFGSILAAAIHLKYVQRLSFPRERSQVITEHMALVNVTVFAILLVAMVGLFVLVGTIILSIELLVFPPNLMTNWPNLEDPSVSFVDLVRVGVFISTIGVLSGALAGGIENRMALRHLALFLDEP